MAEDSTATDATPVDIVSKPCPAQTAVVSVPFGKMVWMGVGEEDTSTGMTV